MKTRVSIEVLSQARGPYALYQTVKTRQKSFAVGSIITIAFNVLSTLVSAITSIIVARALGPQQLGYLTLFITGTATIALFADVMGIYYSNAYLIASGNHQYDASTVRGTVLGYGIIVGLIAGSTFGLLSPVRLLVFRGFDEPIWGLLIGINVVGFTLLNQIRGLFLGHSNFLVLGALGLFQAVLYSFLGLGAIYVWSWRRGLQVAMMHLVATWICVVGALVFLLRGSIAKPSLSYARTCARVGWRAIVANLLGFLQLRVDQYLVNWLLGPQALGLYGVAVSVGELLSRVPAMMGSVIFPLVAAEKNKPLMARITLKRCGLVMVAITLLLAPVAMFAESLIRLLYGDAFALSAQALQALLPAIIFLSGLVIIDNHLAGLGYPMWKIIAILISLSINILGNVVLLPRLGIIGASVTSSVSYLIWLLLIIGYLWRISRSVTTQVLCPDALV